MGFWEKWSTLFDGTGAEEGKRVKTGTLLIILLVLGVGLLLINSLFSPGREKEAAPAAPLEDAPAAGLSPEEQLSRRLAEILSRIRGVSEVEIFLTPGVSGRLEPAVDEEQSRRQTSEGDSDGGSREIIEETVRKSYVILKDPQGNERPLVMEESEPRYRGVLVVAAGVEDDAVKLNVVEALQALLGLPAHRITVLPRS